MAQRWRILAALTFARAAMGFQFQSVAATAPFLTTQLDLDKAQLGWLIGLYLLPGIAIALPGGRSESADIFLAFGQSTVTLYRQSSTILTQFSWLVPVRGRGVNPKLVRIAFTTLQVSGG